MKKKFSLVSSQGRSLSIQPTTNKWLVTATVMVGSIIAIIDTSIVNVAIPQIQANLGASIDEVSSLVTFYIISSVIVMPLTGYLNALWGRKQFYAAVILLFTVSSLFCGLAWSFPALVFFRILQGLGGGALVPSAQAILLETFPKEEHGKAMGIFGLGLLIGPTIGPVLGGYLTEVIGWRSIFAINIPIGIIAAVMVFLFIHNPPYIGKPEGKFDWPGLIALIVGLSSLQYVLETGQRFNWFESKQIIVLLLVGVAAITYLICRELVIRNPIIDLSIFANLTFVAGNIIGILTGLMVFGIMFILPVFLSQNLQYDSFETGMALIPGTVATALIMPIAGLVADRLDSRIPIGIGIALCSVGTWQLSHLTSQSDYWHVFWPQIWRGIGLGLVFVPLSSTTLGYVSQAKKSSASGLFNLLHQLGGSISIAVLTIMLQRLQAYHFSNLSVGIQQKAPAILSNILQQQAMAVSYSNLFLYSALIFLLSYVPLLFLRVRRRAS